MSSGESDFEVEEVTSDKESIKDVKSNKRPHRNKVLPAKLSESVSTQEEKCIDDETSKLPYVQ